MNKATVVLALIALSGCGTGGPPDNAQQTADALTGDAKGNASANPTCALFSAEEVGAYIGEPVKSADNAAMGQGCSWTAQDDDGQVTIAVVPAQYEERATAADGFRNVPEVGQNGFVVPDLGGWVAGAVSGKSFYRVTIAGKAASDAQALALLKDVMKRQP
jgi:predicted small lipoprotein YifL